MKKVQFADTVQYSEAPLPSDYEDQEEPQNDTCDPKVARIIHMIEQILRKGEKIAEANATVQRVYRCGINHIFDYPGEYRHLKGSDMFFINKHLRNFAIERFYEDQVAAVTDLLKNASLT